MIEQEVADCIWEESPCPNIMDMEDITEWAEEQAREWLNNFSLRQQQGMESEYRNMLAALEEKALSVRDELGKWAKDYAYDVLVNAPAEAEWAMQDFEGLSPFLVIGHVGMALKEIVGDKK
jgi:hypothetical protein